MIINYKNTHDYSDVLGCFRMWSKHIDNQSIWRYSQSSQIVKMYKHYRRLACALAVSFVEHVQNRRDIVAQHLVVLSSCLWL